MDIFNITLPVDLVVTAIPITKSRDTPILFLTFGICSYSVSIDLKSSKGLLIYARLLKTAASRGTNSTIFLP